MNDRSTDNTGAVLEKLKVQYPQLKVITIYDLPPNWLGKNHAMYQGVKEATGEWLLFTDADVIFSPRSIKNTVGYALEHTLDHLTKLIDISRSYVLFHPISAMLYLCAVINSTVKAISRGGIEWRGTVYSLKELKNHK